MKLILPATGWRPRAYQQPLWDFLEGGGKRAAVAWHRRSGKDDLALHWTAVSAMQRVGDYWHMLPEASQARKAIWEATDPHKHMRRIDIAFPREIREVTRNNEMMMRLKNGSSWSVVGSDNFNSLVGTPPVGVVFSEYALSNPLAWALLRPILAENGGWALFLSTPRGRNHFHTMMQGGEGWFTQILTADDTGVFTPEQLEMEKGEYTRDHGPQEGPAYFEQEYYCSFEAPLFGSLYGVWIDNLEKQGKITSVPYDPNLKTITAWDLGKRDATSIWIAQLAKHGGEVRIIDHIEGSRQNLQSYIQEVLSKPYSYYHHVFPHDIEHHELMTTESRREVAESLGMRPMLVLERGKVEERIQAVRSFLPRCVFDREKTAGGLNCLRSYRRLWDQKRRVWSSEPDHDWASHSADSFGYLAEGVSQIPVGYKMPERVHNSAWAA